MLVLSMNSKRQRRPNVRLGEIGDVSAAFACGFSQKSNEHLGQKRWKHDFVSANEIESEHDSIFGFSKHKSPEFTVMDHPGVSPWISADMQQNRENKNPNSSKLAFEFVSSNKADMTKSTLNFGTVTRKSRVMKRRSQSTRGKNNVFGSVWNSKLSPEFSGGDGKEDGGKAFVGLTSNTCDDYYYSGNGFKDFCDHDTPTSSKEACEYAVDETTYDASQLGNFNNSWKEDACYERNNAYVKSVVDRTETIAYRGSDVHMVTRWLEGLGFGKYAGIFEMHEVDEETLPLLTLEDLKEMGVFAVGTRRKLYNAIQQLRGEVISA